MGIVYTDGRSQFFYIVERYQVDQNNWVRYTNSTGQEFTCLQEAIDFRFQSVESET
jgi:hypothetical protein